MNLFSKSKCYFKIFIYISPKSQCGSKYSTYKIKIKSEQDYKHSYIVTLFNEEFTYNHLKANTKFYKQYKL